MLRLLADENVDYDLIRGALRRRPALDLVRVHDVGLLGADDRDILAWAATEGRVVLTHDVKTMTRYAIQRLEEGQPLAGVFIAHQGGTTLSALIEDLLLLDEYTETPEWSGQILYLPLR